MKAAADAMAKANLPSSDQHVFVPVDPAWHTIISYQKLRPDAFVGVDHPTAEEMKTLYKEVRYFTHENPHDLNDAVKIVTYYPNGAIYEEIDNLWMEQYCRTFFLSGLLQNYTHWRWGLWLGGLAVDPETKKPNYFSGGSGSVTTHEEHSGTSKTEWHQNGVVFLTDQITDSKSTEITLYIGNDSLHVTKDKEALSLSSESEIWRRPSGSDPQFDYIYPGTPGVFVPKNSDVRPIPPMMGPREQQDAELKQILQEWKIAYPKRRKAFLDHFEKILSDSGQTWKSLNIEFIRDDAAWPGK
jgi:hypothetical protein